MINNIKPTQFPVSIKCFDVLNVKKKQINVIHTFDNVEDFNDWKRLVIEWDNFPTKKGQKSRETHYELLEEPVTPTMEIIQFV